MPELFANLVCDKTRIHFHCSSKTSSLVTALEVIPIFHIINKYLLLNNNYFSIGIIDRFPSSSIKMLKKFLNLAFVFLPTVSLDLFLQFCFLILYVCPIPLKHFNLQWYLEVSICVWLSCNSLFNIVKTGNYVPSISLMYP